MTDYSNLVERLRAGARLFQFSGNEEEELAQAATEAADALSQLSCYAEPVIGDWPDVAVVAMAAPAPDFRSMVERLVGHYRRGGRPYMSDWIEEAEAALKTPAAPAPDAIVELPTLPEFSTRLKMCIDRDHLTDPEFLRSEIRWYARDYARAAVEYHDERTAAPAPDADAIMALAECYATCRANWQGLAADQAKDSLRAAVEQIVAERDGRRPMSSAEGMVQRARAERAEERKAFWLEQAELREKWLKKAEQEAAELRQAIIGIVRDGIINAPCPTPAQWKETQIAVRPHLAAALKEKP